MNRPELFPPSFDSIAIHILTGMLEPSMPDRDEAWSRACRTEEDQTYELDEHMIVRIVPRVRVGRGLSVAQEGAINEALNLLWRPSITALTDQVREMVLVLEEKAGSAPFSVYLPHSWHYKFTNYLKKERPGRPTFLNLEVLEHPREAIRVESSVEVGRFYEVPLEGGDPRCFRCQHIGFFAETGETRERTYRHGEKLDDQIELACGRCQYTTWKTVGK